MVACVALNIYVLMSLVTFFIKDKCTAVHIFYVFVNRLPFFFNVAFVTVDRAFIFVSMAFNAESVKQLSACKALMTVGAFFYPLIIMGFMMARFAFYT